MNKIVFVIALLIVGATHAGTWFPVGPGHDVHIVRETPRRHTIVGANVLGIEAAVTVPGYPKTETVAVQTVPGTVTVPAQQTVGYNYIPTEGKIVTTVYANGTTVTEAPVAPAPRIVTEKVYVPGHYVTRVRFGRVFQKWVPGHYEYVQRVVQ